MRTALCFQDEIRNVHSVAAQYAATASTQHEEDVDGLWHLFCRSFITKGSQQQALPQLLGSAQDLRKLLHLRHATPIDDDHGGPAQQEWQSQRQHWGNGAIPDQQLGQISGAALLSTDKLGNAYCHHRQQVPSPELQQKADLLSLQHPELQRVQTCLQPHPRPPGGYSRYPTSSGIARPASAVHASPHSAAVLLLPHLDLSCPPAATSPCSASSSVLPSPMGPPPPPHHPQCHRVEAAPKLHRPQQCLRADSGPSGREELHKPRRQQPSDQLQQWLDMDGAAAPFRQGNFLQKQGPAFATNGSDSCPQPHYERRTGAYILPAAASELPWLAAGACLMASGHVSLAVGDGHGNTPAAGSTVSSAVRGMQLNSAGRPVLVLGELLPIEASQHPYEGQGQHGGPPTTGQKKRAADWQPSAEPLHGTRAGVSVGHQVRIIPQEARQQCRRSAFGLGGQGFGCQGVTDAGDDWSLLAW